MIEQTQELVTTKELKKRAEEFLLVDSTTVTYWLRPRKSNGLEAHVVKRRSGRGGKGGRVYISWEGFLEWYQKSFADQRHEGK